jgi:uncharacterized protein
MKTRWENWSGLALLILSLTVTSAIAGPSFAQIKARAETGDARAQGFVGFSYAQGRGVAKDLAEAVKWYRKAADQGDATAQFNLGNMYAKGLGVPRDDVRAYMWWLIAEAKESRAKMAKGLTARQRAEGQRMAKEWMPGTSPE